MHLVCLPVQRQIHPGGERLPAHFLKAFLQAQLSKTWQIPIAALANLSMSKLLQASSTRLRSKIPSRIQPEYWARRVRSLMQVQGC
jgi:hypothetical protein